MHDEHEEHHVHLGHETDESPREYKKLAAVFGGILVMSLFLAWARGFALERFLSDFMAVFFITFAAFKLYAIDDFVAAFRGYDIIAKRLRPYAYAYPFIEGLLGLLYLLLNNSFSLNLVTIVFTGVSAIGVMQELKNKSNIMCACLGTIIKLPLSKVSLIENLSMFVMAVIMILL